VPSVSSLWRWWTLRETDEIVDRGLHSPLYARAVPDATHRGEGRNDGCGDFVHFDFKIKDGILVACGHQCKACVLTTAMADFVCEALEGQTPDFVRTLNLFKLMGIPVGPERRDCILVVDRVLRVSLHL